MFSFSLACFSFVVGNMAKLIFHFERSPKRPPPPTTSKNEAKTFSKAAFLINIYSFKVDYSRQLFYAVELLGHWSSHPLSSTLLFFKGVMLRKRENKLFSIPFPSGIKKFKRKKFFSRSRFRVDIPTGANRPILWEKINESWAVKSERQFRFVIKTISIINITITI